MALHTVLDDKLHWYKDAIIYELHIKAFNDSNADGIGDFTGLLQKLDYLQDLGITAIWVLPFYPSPLRDDGYDIADYYSINPTYGNVEQFKQFLNEAHKRNLKVITELVINHTSDQHPWFQRARRAPKGSPERDYYVWTDDPTKYKDVRIIFQDFEASNWSWDPVAQQYYWHRFFHHQPDLNYDSPLVQEEVFKILDYWCAMGVDGFRLDAVPYLFEREDTNGENLPETHVFLKKLRRHVDEHFPGTVFLAEANMWPEDSASYFGNGDECHMNYHFPVMPRMFMALQREDRYPITDIFDQTPAIPATCQWAIFLRNHDELTLEMVTDEERDYMYKVYAKDPRAKINLGIRHRLAPLMGNSRNKIELMNSLLFSLPGTPVIYYGDEIGMGDNFYLGDRDGVRTPMQWSPDRNGGFSAANPQKLYLPLILDPEYNYEAVNVEVQRSNTSSLFWYMKRILSMRRQHKAFGRGDMQFLNVGNPKILAFTRTYQDQTLLIVVNLSKYAQAAEIDLSAFNNYVPVELFSKNRFPAIRDNHPYILTLSPYAFYWFEMEKSQVETDGGSQLPELNLVSWDAITSRDALSMLEEYILLPYLTKTTWFTSNVAEIHHLAITNYATIPLQESNAVVLLVEVNYDSGLPETYQLAVAFAKDKMAGKLNTNCPEALIANIKVDGQEGFLCDAFYTEPVQQELIKKLASGSLLKVKDGIIRFYANDSLQQFVASQPEIRPRVHPTEVINTAITYNNSFFLKLYRKVDRTENPDVELTRHLTEEAHFPYVPAFVGAIEWQLGRDTMTLGMMQVMIENHGDYHSFMLERLNNFIERILARDREKLLQYPFIGSLTRPVSFSDLPEDLQEFLSPTAAEQISLLGVRTGQMHLALAADKMSKAFQPEDFSLHYQRSLFSSMQALVREATGNLQKYMDQLQGEVRQDAETVLTRRQDILNEFKKIYAKKLDVEKIRIHGNYNTRQVLISGKDIAIKDFSGNPYRSYSEKRLKRSPLRDVATMIHSLYNVAYEGFLINKQLHQNEMESLRPLLLLWVHYMTSFFMKAYLDTVAGSPLIPKEKEEVVLMIHTYLLEKAVAEVNKELVNRPDWVRIPLRVIKAILK
ncbi:maltose alpha-D-glucosyltransferase [Ilyomonas limi]|uniref:maltose alpha-D-glucosyltransferase n=1 Tax=Ilyomonas limi TaxID=2575867 RepID=A0A4U3L929_9BACT|nr:maltose alpha-D-glucosyltransferase [Ilyomonas limi]TKK71590.1 maltose alpha-D-glucosyltransferase [Ilyomonas limi]